MFEANTSDQEFHRQGATRVRLVRDQSAPATTPRFSLQAGEMYRIAYSIHGSEERVSRSVALFEGETERRSWKGDVITCLDFMLPQGRKMSLIADQVIDARAAQLGEHGKWVLVDDGRARGRRRTPRAS